MAEQRQQAKGMTAGVICWELESNLSLISPCPPPAAYFSSQGVLLNHSIGNKEHWEQGFKWPRRRELFLFKITLLLNYLSQKDIAHSGMGGSFLTAIQHIMFIFPLNGKA